MTAKPAMFTAWAMLGLATLAMPAYAQDDSGDAAQDQAQSTSDTIERDARSVGDAVERDARRISDAASGTSHDSSQDVDPTVQKFDKDGNTNYDADGNYIGCHGMGCKVDNPDTASSSDDHDSSRSSFETRRSRSSSTSVSFGMGGPPRGSWDVNAVLGKWTIGAKDSGSSCSLTLFPDGSSGLRRAWTSAGCPGNFFSVMRWRAAGRDLQLTDLSGTPIGSFRQVGPGRFEGSSASDGTPVFLSR